MLTTALFRRLLWAAALFNVLAAVILGFPASPLGQMAGLPAEVPLAYRAIVAAFVLLFAGCYAWLGTQTEPDRPMVALGAIGKALVVVVVIGLWLAAEASLTSLAIVSGDLVFAALFIWWLNGSSRPVEG
jgi:hypothetical protein